MTKWHHADYETVGLKDNETTKKNCVDHTFGSREKLGFGNWTVHSIACTLMVTRNFNLVSCLGMQSRYVRMSSEVLKDQSTNVFLSTLY